MLKLITICMLSLFCMAPTCNGPTKNPEGLYQCITIRSSESPVTGTWIDQSGNTIEGSWLTSYEVPIMRINDREYRFVTSGNQEGRGRWIQDSNARFESGRLCIGNCVSMAGDESINLSSRNGQFEACRKIRVFTGRMADQKNLHSEVVERYNTTFGDGTSTCSLALISGPPTCGSY